MISVDFTPKKLQKPMDPSTERATMITPDKPSSTCDDTQQIRLWEGVHSNLIELL